MWLKEIYMLITMMKDPKFNFFIEDRGWSHSRALTFAIHEEKMS